MKTFECNIMSFTKFTGCTVTGVQLVPNTFATFIPLFLVRVKIVLKRLS